MCLEPFAYGLRDGPWFEEPFKIDRTLVPWRKPAAWRREIKDPGVPVLPLAENISDRTLSGWCTYSEAFDSPETELLCSGVNTKSPSGAAVWRQGNLMHFCFNLAPTEMNERARQFFVNCVVYASRFGEDRPIIHSPGRLLVRAHTDSLVASAEPDKDLLEYYFAPETLKLEKADDWPTFQNWYKQNREYLRERRAGAGSLVLDEEAKAFGVPAHKADFFRAALAALRSGGTRASLAATLLQRYVPDGPNVAVADTWQRWFEANEKYLFFSETGGYRWYIDPLAKKRGRPTAELRGERRATKE
jgi:hypothetical protein